MNNDWKILIVSVVLIASNRITYGVAFWKGFDDGVEINMASNNQNCKDLGWEGDTHHVVCTWPDIKIVRKP